ncbi:MAG: hypothetical protein GF418_14100 [Chitinivibrionales bacterium]|nr:hypothetical protein [Chitinivibrionales bacterium]MBD3396751.1 hypothetical protein [Chitinivibrionales bacterium]
MLGLHVLSFPGLVFFLHNLRAGWRKWHRPWRNSRLRFGGWLTIKDWTTQMKKDSFMESLQQAKLDLRQLEGVS